MINLLKRWWAQDSLLIAVVTMVVMSIAGCGGGGSGNGGSSSSSRPANITVNTGSLVLGTDNSENVNQFLDIVVPARGMAKRTEAIYYGVRDANGLPSRITQALFWQTSQSQGARVFYDTQERPIQIANDASGEFVNLSWTSATEFSLRVYDANGAFVGGSLVQANGDSYTVSPLPQVTGTAFLRASRLNSASGVSVSSDGVSDQQLVSTQTTSSTAVINTLGGLLTISQSNSTLANKVFADLVTQGANGQLAQELAGQSNTAATILSKTIVTKNLAVIVIVIIAYVVATIVVPIISNYIHKPFPTNDKDGNAAEPLPTQKNPTGTPQPTPTATPTAFTVTLGNHGFGGTCDVDDDVYAYVNGRLVASYMSFSEPAGKVLEFSVQNGDKVRVVAHNDGGPYQFGPDIRLYREDGKSQFIGSVSASYDNSSERNFFDRTITVDFP